MNLRNKRESNQFIVALSVVLLAFAFSYIGSSSGNYNNNYDSGNDGVSPITGMQVGGSGGTCPPLKEESVNGAGTCGTSSRCKYGEAVVDCKDGLMVQAQSACSSYCATADYCECKSFFYDENDVKVNSVITVDGERIDCSQTENYKKCKKLMNAKKKFVVSCSVMAKFYCKLKSSEEKKSKTSYSYIE